MKKVAFLLLAALSAKSALAGEVGARDPQFANSAEMAVAVVDVGVSTNWMSAPVSAKAVAEQKQHLQMSKDISAQVSEDLEKRIAEEMELSFSY